MKDLEPDLAAELVAELRRDSSPVSEQALARLRERLGIGLGAAATLEPAPTAPGPSLAAHARLLVTVAFAIGAGVGAAGHALLAAPEPKVVYRDRVVAEAPPVVVPMAPSAVTLDQLELAPAPLAPRGSARASVLRPPATAASVAAEASPPADDGFSAELRLLDEAKRALREGDGQRALQSVEAHAQRYPASALDQEREALSIKALIGSGRSDEARTRADAFRRRYPQSMLLDSIENALRSIP